MNDIYIIYIIRTVILHCYIHNVSADVRSGLLQVMGTSNRTP